MNIKELPGKYEEKNNNTFFKKEELLLKIGRRLVRGHCDNWAACKIVEFRSMKEDGHRVTMRTNELIQKFEVNFGIVWQSRDTEEIRFAG